MGAAGLGAAGAAAAGAASNGTSTGSDRSGIKSMWPLGWGKGGHYHSTESSTLSGKSADTGKSGADSVMSGHTSDGSLPMVRPTCSFLVLVSVWGGVLLCSRAWCRRGACSLCWSGKCPYIL